MERQQCKLCTRSFDSRKALGGHMRSHMFPLPLPPKHQLSTDLTHSTPSFQPEKDLTYGLRENPKKSYKLVDPHFLQLGRGLLFQDSDTETESRNPTRGRSTRVVAGECSDDVEMKKVKLKKFSSTESVTELEVVSSGYNYDDDDGSNLVEDEDVASCLMTLSRGKWRVKELSRSRKRYKRETCKKEFESFPALGGHGTSHKKVKKRQEDLEESMEEKPRKNTGKKLHECPVCFRVFGSGQALGGHKRSHFLGSSSTTTTTTTVSTSSSAATASPRQLNADNMDSRQENKDENISFGFIDLNLPVTVEYKDSRQC